MTAGASTAVFAVVPPAMKVDDRQDACPTRISVIFSTAYGDTSAI